MDPIELYNIRRDREAEAHLRSTQGERERRIANAKATISVGGMTHAHWDTLTKAEKDAVRDTSEMHPMLIGYEGKRVRVSPKRAFGASTFRVGRSTGWKPIHLAMRGHSIGSSDVIGKNEPFTSVTFLGV